MDGANNKTDITAKGMKMSNFYGASWSWVGRPRDRIPVRRDFLPVQTGPGAHPATCTMGTGSFPGVKSSRGMTLTPHPLLVPWSWKGRAIPLLPLWAVRPVKSLSACTRVRFTFFTYEFNFKSSDVSSITPTKCTLYIPHFSHMFRCISHHLRGELPYSKPSSCTQLLSMVHWLSHKI